MIEYCGAVLGSTFLMTAVPLTATPTTAATATTPSTTVFGWCAVLGGLCNPFPLFFPFYPHSLFFLFSFLSRLRAGRFCRGELRSPAGNNYPTGNNYPAGNNWVNQGIWAHAVRPYGFGGGFWRFLVFLGDLGDLGARGAPLRIWGWFLEVFGFFGKGGADPPCAP